jgi:hypothetical protein
MFTYSLLFFCFIFLFFSKRFLLEEYLDLDSVRMHIHRFHELLCPTPGAFDSETTPGQPTLSLSEKSRREKAALNGTALEPVVSRSGSRSRRDHTSLSVRSSEPLLSHSERSKKERTTKDHVISKDHVRKSAAVRASCSDDPHSAVSSTHKAPPTPRTSEEKNEQTKAVNHHDAVSTAEWHHVSRQFNSSSAASGSGYVHRPHFHFRLGSSSS